MPTVMRTGTKPSPSRIRVATMLCTTHDHHSTARTSSACSSAPPLTWSAVARVMMKNENTKTRSKKTSNRSTRAPGATGTAGPRRPRHPKPLTDRVCQRRVGGGPDCAQPGRWRGPSRVTSPPPWEDAGTTGRRREG